MKKLIAVVLAAGLVVGALGMPATAKKKKKKKKKAKPVATVLYMHGETEVGEVDGAQWVADSTERTLLDTVEPTGSTPKSMTIANPALNDQCSGLPLGFPTFTGPLQGTIKGDVKLIGNFVSAPRTIKARLWTDTPVFSCNDGYIEPASEVDVQLPAGQGEVEIVFPNVNLPANYNIMVEILAYSGTDYQGQVGRFLYDSTSAMSRLEFKCLPPKGAKTCA